MEAIAPGPEQQNGYLNTQVATAIRDLLPFSDILDDPWMLRGDGLLYEATYELDDGAVVEVGINDFGNYPIDEQPFYLRVQHPFVDGSREVEDYLFGVIAHRRKGNSFLLTSDTFLQTMDEAGKLKAVPLLGYSATRNLNYTEVFGSRKERPSRKERKALRNAMSLQMDEDRAERLVAMLSQCNESNRRVTDND